MTAKVRYTQPLAMVECQFLVLLIGLSIFAAMLPPVSAFAMPNQVVHATAIVDLSSKGVFPLQLSDVSTDVMATTGSTSSLLLSALGNDIDWNNPGQAFGTIVLLAYIGISVAAGLKYIIKDGWRPKL